MAMFIIRSIIIILALVGYGMKHEFKSVNHLHGGNTYEYVMKHGYYTRNGEKFAFKNKTIPFVLATPTFIWVVLFVLSLFD